MVTSASEVVEAPGDSIPFYVKPTLIDLVGGRYFGPILPIYLAGLVAGRQAVDGCATRGGGDVNNGGGDGSGI